jgi:hypothetical protein
MERAKAAARAALQLCVTHGYTEFAIVPLECLALIAARTGDVSKAARIAGFTDNAVRASNAPRERTEQHSFDLLMDVLRTSLAEEVLASHLVAGAAISQAVVLQEGMSV